MHPNNTRTLSWAIAIAAACIAALAYMDLAGRTRIFIATTVFVALGYIVLRLRRLWRRLYLYLLACINDLFEDGSVEEQTGGTHGPEELHAGASAVDTYHASMAEGSAGLLPNHSAWQHIPPWTLDPRQPQCQTLARPPSQHFKILLLEDWGRQAPPTGPRRCQV